MEERERVSDTKMEEPLSGFVRIHGTFFKHRIDVFFAVITGDFFDVLNGFADIVWDRNPRS